MTVASITQSILDTLLLPDGILSHRLRRVKADSIEGSAVPVNNNEYVVYRIISTRGGAYGDGNAQLVKQYVDINYYYAYDKIDTRHETAERRMAAIKKAFLRDPRFRLANGEKDLPDTDNAYRGINIELLFIGIADDNE